MTIISSIDSEEMQSLLCLKIRPPLTTQLRSSCCFEIADRIHEQGVSDQHRHDCPLDDPSLAHSTMTLNSFKDAAPLLPVRGAPELLRPHFGSRHLGHLNEIF